MRALRRDYERRMKARARRIMRLWFRNRFAENPRKIGVNASTHCRPCGFRMRQTDRKNIPPLRERRFEEVEF